MNEIILYSIVKVTHFNPEQQLRDKSILNQLCMVVEDSSEYMLLNLVTGLTTGWWNKKQVEKIGQIDSVKNALDIIKQVNILSDAKYNIANILREEEITFYLEKE
jgi:hypothetical protein